MLTKSDLSQIRTIVREESKTVAKQEVRAVVKQEVKVEVAAALKPVMRILKKIRADLEMAVGHLDRDRWNLEKRFNEHTVHPPASA